MKFKILIAVVLFSYSAFAQKSSYDAVLAKKLGADDYGMKSYVMVILVTGKVNIAEKTKQDSIFAGHMSNMGKLADEGKLVMAGPFGKNDIQYRGVFIFNTASVDEAKKWTATDLAVQAGVFDLVYIPWYGSAALMEMNTLHEKVQKISF